MSLDDAIRKLRRAVEDAAEQPRLEADIADVLGFLQERRRRRTRARARKALAFSASERAITFEQKRIDR